MSATKPCHSITPLARRLLFWVLLISAFNALLAISVQLTLDYRRDLADLGDNLSFIRKSQSESLAAAAWNFDQPLVQVQLDGLVQSPWIAGAMVRYGPNEGAHASAGTIDEKQADLLSYPLEFAAGTRRIKVGRLIVAPNLDLVYQRTFDRGIVVAATQGMKTLIFSMALLILLHYLVTRHLSRLLDYVRSFQLGEQMNTLKLERGKNESEDELTTLAAALNQNYAKLNEYHLAEQRQLEYLEQEVARRTQHLDQALLEQQAIFDNSLTGIAFLKNRVFMRCNQSFERIFGYEAGELIGQSTRTLYPSYEDFELAAKHFMPILQSGQVAENDFQLIRKDGSKVWCAASLNRLILMIQNRAQF
ncbi:PAS domain S-box protein [Chitinibacter sp. FCG-7]|uniref:PAS domain S-box protein n=1 Tax=Chitinibacter mangrovi TaxID=3153927 RepID=A0AAU7F6F8_9NEIS